MLGDKRIHALVRSSAVTGKVEDGDLVAVASALKHLGMAQRVHGVVVAGTPMLRHGQPRELIVFRVTFEASRSIDEVHEVVGVALRDRGKELGFLASFELFWQLVQKRGDRVLHLVHLFDEIREGARAARVLDLLLPGCDFREVARELAACVPEVDLKNERVRQTLAGHARVRHKPLKRRIRDEAAIPIVFALNLDCGETGRQRAARHHMLGSDHLRPGVEIDQVAAAHIHRAEAETRVMLFRVYTVEVDEALKRRSQRPRVIVARRLDGTGRMKPRIGDSRPEEAPAIRRWQP